MKENIETGILTEFKLLDIASNLLAVVAPEIFADPLDTQATDFVHYIVEKSTIEFQKLPRKETSFFGLSKTYLEGEVTIDKARTGYCIRTRDTIPYNIERPYSKSAFDSWAKYGNKSYEEKYCHKCGKPNKSSVYKPVCYGCYKES